MHSVLFYRDFRCFTGGHLKVWDYFNHVNHSPNFVSQIFFSKESIWDQNNLWFSVREKVLPAWPSEKPDVYFLAGLNWRILKEEQWKDSQTPIINLIQHLRHVEPGNLRHSFLSNKAIRICVSPEIEMAIRQSGQVNGPLYTIPNALDLESFPQPIAEAERDIDLLIVALKKPNLGKQVYDKFKGSRLKVKLLTARLERPVFLNYLNQAKTTLFLPNSVEGSYLPALEGMALGTLVICPDCVGNRSFCLDRVNCLRPEYHLEKIYDDIVAALKFTFFEKSELLKNANLMVKNHSLLKEREALLEILENVFQIW